ncbi:hypothetical protein [Paenibacillus flagellatus]|uniref:hypothetical protein n=1 Tax=Paenibacillus flagellatus TaxID=2211139 RepID=UPI0013053EC4|nr:hypothetical protein [Paenibacillus flagellatus]
MNKANLVTFLRHLQGVSAEIEPCVDVLLGLQRSAGPVTEAVTVIKHEHPRLHAQLKARLRGNPGLSLVFQLSMDYETAKRNLSAPD